MSARKTLLPIAICAIASAIALAAFPSLGSPTSHAPAHGPEPRGNGDLLRIGSIALQPRSEAARFRGFAAALVARLRGVDDAEIVVVPDVAAMANALAQGAVDVYVDSPLPVAQVHRVTPIVPLAVRHKGAQREYAAVVFTRADSGMRSIDDLRGRRIVFTDRFSTSGYLLPATLLRERGLELCELPREALAGPDRVSFGFSHDDETSLVWVLKGLAAAAALGEPQFERLARAQRHELRVLERTDPLPRQIVCTRADLDDELQRSIQDALLVMTDDEATRRALLDFDQTTRFSLLEEGEFERVLATADRVEEALGK